jgi:hypothetical protein
MRKNLPVPPGPVVPLNRRWLWWTGPPLLLALAYRLIPARARGSWNPARTPNSHRAVAAIRAGGGWRSFFHFAVPAVKDGIPFWLDG